MKSRYGQVDMTFAFHMEFYFSGPPAGEKSQNDMECIFHMEK